MRVLVTGREGQLVRSLVEKTQAVPSLTLLPTGRPEADLEHPGSIASAIQAAAPDAVINAAAYTAVDRAEEEPDRARRINADAAGEVAAAAAALGIPIIQLSTDYVFNGSGGSAYSEEAPVGPINIYGRTKLEGEEQVRRSNPDHLIVRTSWVYSPFGSNFVKTMLRLACERDEVAVVADQVGSPTSALDLSDSLLHVLNIWSRGGATGLGEIYHVAGQGRCSWADFAEEVFRVSASFGGPAASVRRITTPDFKTKATRPRNSVLETSKFEQEFKWRFPNWQHSLPAVVERLL